jgi:hypothetical protein
VLALAATGCGTKSNTSTDAWDREATGVIAQQNDVVSLQFLPALVGTNNDPADYAKDLDGIADACDALPPVAAKMRTLSVEAPAAREAAASRLGRLAATVDRIASGCLGIVASGDGDGFENNEQLRDDFNAASELVAQVGEWVPDDSPCPDRLIGKVESCDLQASPST